MGQQIGIAQSPKDESDMLSFILARGSFLAAPRFHTSSTAQAFALGACETPEQLIIPASVLEDVLAHCTPVIASKTPRYQLNPYSGLVLEWIRTPRLDTGEFVSTGRIYYATTGPASGRDDAAVARTLARSLFARIRRSYPMRSAQRYPTHVGPDLARMLVFHEARLVHPNGKSVSLQSASDA